MIIRPANSINGTISVPGDKSISHRAAIIAAMAAGVSRIENFATGEDCASTIKCLRQLGVEIQQDGTNVYVKGVGKTGFRAPVAPLDCGNSGTTIRLLAGVLAGQNFDSVLTGDESLLSRPMNRVIEPLKLMGAEIDSSDGFAPLTIRGQRPLNAVRYEVPVASAQVKSCVLLAGLNAQGRTIVIEDTATRDHTERMLRWLGADVTISGEVNSEMIEISGDSIMRSRNIAIPGDISSAAFFMIAAASLPNSQIGLKNVGINSSRSYLLAKLRSLGVGIEVREGHATDLEPVAQIVVHGNGILAGENDANVVRGRETAQLIDEIPILSVLGTQLEGGLEVRDAKELRIKETDRIAAVVENLRRMSADVEEFEVGFRVEKSQLKGAEVDSFGDHRIAMAFAVAGLLAEGETTIRNPDCADISFPGFYETLESVVKR